MMLIDCNCLVYKQEFYWSKPGLMTDIKGGLLGEPWVDLKHSRFASRMQYGI